MVHEVDQIYLDNRYLPFHSVALRVVDFLKVQPFMSEFNGAIYSYPREDNPNLSLPACFIYPDYIKSNGHGFYQDSMLVIEIARNKNTNNRGAWYPFLQGVIERIIQVLCYNNAFFVRNLNRELPYITQFGNKFSSQYKEGKIGIHVQAWTSEYLRHVRKKEFVPSGRDGMTTVQVDVDKTRYVPVFGKPPIV